MKIISSKIVCEKTLQLIKKSLVVGYIDSNNGKHIVSTEGTPQGSVLSPLLANIVLNELDTYMTEFKKSFNIGDKKARNKVYDRLTARIYKLQKTKPGEPKIKALAIERRSVPSLMYNDPYFKRLMYLRYADNFVILISGTSNDTKMIRNRVSDILTKKCGLELNKDKTIITALKEGFYFLGAWCIKPSSQKAGLSTNVYGNPSKYRMRMRIMIPIEKLIEKLYINKFITRGADGLPKATARKDLINFEHHEIINFYNLKIQGLLIFYRFACNLTSLRKIIMFLHLSCALTMTLKYKLRTCKKAFRKFGRFLKDPSTDIALKIPTSLEVKHYYAGKDSIINLEDILKIS